MLRSILRKRLVMLSVPVALLCAWGGVALTTGSASGAPTSSVTTSSLGVYSATFAGTGQPVLQGGFGGTSFVAPQLNASTAVIDSYLGHRVGFWNPDIYAAGDVVIGLDQISHSMGEGGVAATAIRNDLCVKRPRWRSPAEQMSGS